MKHWKRLSCPLKIAIPVVFVFSLLIFAFIISLESEYLTFWLFGETNTIALCLWNYLPILFTFALIFFISGNAPFTVIFSGSLWVTMGLVNHYKLALRGEPFVPGDLLLTRELFGIIKNVNTSLLIMAIILIVVVVVGIALSFILVRRSSLKWYVRIIGAVTVLTLAVGSYLSVYQKDEIYEQFPVDGYAYNLADVSGSRGFPFMFLYEIHHSFVTVPDGYAKEEFRAADENQSSPKPIGDAEKPHIIMIMSEAYSDYSENTHLTLAEDPMTAYKNIAADALMSGYLVTDTLGGGTVISEYEALTGISEAILPMPASSPYSFIRQEIDSVPRVLSSLGYDTMALHPGFGWFYNRQNVYPLLGFDVFENEENCFLTDRVSYGGYISDETTLNQLIDDFQNHFNQSDVPLFQFLVTIENHGGYTNKYDLTEPLVSSDIPLSDELIMELSNYFVGIEHADEELSRLVDYLNSLSEPVILVYFGDHKPGLSSDIFSALGYEVKGNFVQVSDSAALNRYTTPFFIWENSAARETMDLSQRLEELGLNEVDYLSAIYLGSTLLELLEFDDLSPYMQFVNEIRDELPVLNKEVWIDKNGVMGESSAMPETMQETLDQYKKWSYYKIFDDEITE